MSKFPRVFLLATLLGCAGGVFGLGISVRQSNDPYYLNDIGRFRDEILSTHNSWRAKFGVSAMTWDNELYKFSKNVAMKCVFGHSGGPPGESLYSSTDGSPKQSIDAFAEEYKKYNPTTGFDDSNIPDAPPNVFREIGHYTQLAWKDTTKVGCAVSDRKCSMLGNQMWLVVCSYWPRGNIGSKTENLFIKNVGLMGGPRKEPDPANNPPVPQYSGTNVQIPAGLQGGGGGGGNPAPAPSSPPPRPTPPGPRANVKTVTVTVPAKRDQPTPR